VRGTVSGRWQGGKGGKLYKETSSTLQGRWEGERREAKKRNATTGLLLRALVHQRQRWKSARLQEKKKRHRLHLQRKKRGSVQPVNSSSSSEEGVLRRTAAILGFRSPFSSL